MTSSSSAKRKVKPVAVGCVISASDIPIVIISFTCFAAFIIYGASNAALGASVPALSRNLNKPESRIGFIFITRGSGFLAGTLGSAALMTYPKLPLSKEIITCLASVLMGISTYFMSCTGNYSVVLGLSIFQGLGFGGIDCISNCLFPELWGTRIQPWMQALHLCYGIGAMIGPSLVGYMGYVNTYRILGICAFIPLIALQGYRFFSSASAGMKALTGLETSTIDTDISSSDTRNKQTTAYNYVSTSVTEDEEDMDTSTYGPFSSHRAGLEDSAHSDMLSPALRQHDSCNSLNSTADTVDTEEGSNKSFRGDTPTPVAAAAESHPVTFTLRMLILCYYVIYTGMEAGYAGWIPVYVLQEDIATTDAHAAYIAATFWATMTIGRMLAVVTAMAFSATFMLRFHLFFGTMCSVMFMFVASVGTFQYSLIVAALMGLALSAIYPLVMTIVIDYGYTMDSYSTTLFMVGATMGEAGLPMAIGFLLEAFGPDSMPWTILFCACLQVGLYAALHFIAAQGAVHDDAVHISSCEVPSVAEVEDGLDGLSIGDVYTKLKTNTGKDSIENKSVEMTEM